MATIVTLTEPGVYVDAYALAGKTAPETLMVQPRGFIYLEPSAAQPADNYDTFRLGKGDPLVVEAVGCWIALADDTPVQVVVG